MGLFAGIALKHRSMRCGRCSMLRDGARSKQRVAERKPRCDCRGLLNRSRRGRIAGCALIRLYKRERGCRVPGLEQATSVRREAFDLPGFALEAANPASADFLS